MSLSLKKKNLSNGEIAAYPASLLGKLEIIFIKYLQ